MPVTTRGKKIVEKATGKVVGTSKSPAMAKKAARVRNAVLHGWRPTR
jgi:hypothetical protein